MKAFFFPLMFVWLNNSTTQRRATTTSRHASWSNLRAYDFLYDFIFFIDLLFTTVGYALCFRPIDTHLRSAEPTFLGWGVALFCYEPFFGMLFERQYVHYQGLGFGDWLAPYPNLRWAWAIAILLLITVYVLATVAFGVRFSNLTHRGILTNGPYRFIKHPAYVSKNLSWWLLSIPFVVNDERGDRDQALHRACSRELHVLHAGEDRGAAPVARPDLRGVRALDERARVAALDEAGAAAEVLRQLEDGVEGSRAAYLQLRPWCTVVRLKVARSHLVRAEQRHLPRATSVGVAWTGRACSAAPSMWMCSSARSAKGDFRSWR